MELIHNKPDFAKLAGGVDLSKEKLSLTEGDEKYVENIFDYDVQIIHNLLSIDSSLDLINLFEKQGVKAPVSIQGRTDIIDDRVGSIRTSGWSEMIANELFDLVKPDLKHIVIENDYYPSDWWQEQPYIMWEPVGISPMLRYMRYEKDSQHYAHYDVGFIYKDSKYRTLKSIVLYLTSHDEKEGGATRFIDDIQQFYKPIYQRDHKDWIREVTEDEVLFKVTPEIGTMLIFPHRLCHDVEKYIGDSKRIIIRGDIIYKGI